jgi:CRP/FNR family cyclic AMP-dependent transcriptional regulator
MKADGVWGNIFRLGQRQDPIAEILRHIPLFKELTTKELHILEKLVHARTYKPEEAVFVESEPGSGMYVIQSGHVDVLLKYQSDQPLVLAELGPGDFFRRNGPFG